MLNKLQAELRESRKNIARMMQNNAKALLIREGLLFIAYFTASSTLYPG
jgi:hypothetical protein